MTGRGRLICDPGLESEFLNSLDYIEKKTTQKTKQRNPNKQTKVLYNKREMIQRLAALLLQRAWVWFSAHTWWLIIAC